MAIQYGMTETQFWYGDIRLLKVYQKAYYRNISYSAWKQGAYNFEAYSKANYNLNKPKKTSPDEQYSQWKDPYESKYKPKITKDNLEEEFRKQQADQQDWLFHR